MIRHFFKQLFSPSSPAVISFGRTDTGLARDQNEDSFSILESRRLYLVADGMGGHNAGEVASRVAIESLVAFFSAERIKQMSGNDEEVQHQMITGFQLANDRVMTLAANDEALAGMGCTLVACLVDDAILHTCHVGDARCYITGPDGLAQITTDHTALSSFKGGGREKTVGQSPPPRHIITRAIGFPFPKDPEYHSTPLGPGNRVLLCSDGLWSMLPDERLNELLLTAPTPEVCCDTMIREANKAGGKDNITAVVLFF